MVRRERFRGGGVRRPKTVMRASAAGLCATLALVLPAASDAAVGDYRIVGGTKAQRALVLLRALGGREWYSTVPVRPHGDYGCERFAAALAWAYWPSRDNVMKPEAPSIAPARFRMLLEALLRDHARAHLRSQPGRSRSPERRA